MKDQQLSTTAVLIALAVVTAATTRADNGSPATIAFRVQQGDTFSNLFGPDWEKAYRQNRVTVVRSGRPVTSPDVLIEGSIVAVTPDTRLRPRAVARLSALSHRREELSAQLAQLAPMLARVPAAQVFAAECREILANDIRFASDLDYLARQITQMRRLADSYEPLPPPRQRPILPTWWVPVTALIAIVFAVTIFWRRSRPTYPEGAVRCREALADIEAALRG